MNTTDIRQLTDAELDEAAGAEPNLGGYVYCVGEGIKVAGTCSPTMNDLVQVILDTAEKGRQIQQQHGGGGRPK